jgi:hypothetical protein
MKSVSYWASRHLWPARLLLVAGQVLLTLLAIFVGKSLAQLDIVLPFYLIYLLVPPFALAWILHPGGSGHKTFSRRKWCEGTVAGIGFLVIVCMCSQPLPALNRLAPAWSNTPAAYPVTIQKIEQHAVDKKPVLKKGKVRQKLADNIQVIRKLYRQGPRGVKYALIIFSVVVALGLVSLLSALSCTIACNGSETLALFVFLLGSTLVIFLTIRVIKAIQRKYLKELQKRNGPPGEAPPSL